MCIRDSGMFPTTSVQGGVRPVIVVSNNKANTYSSVITVAVSYTHLLNIQKLIRHHVEGNSWEVKSLSERVILHSDMNCFYASVEMLHHPEFAGMPLAVGGDPEARHGIVLTANYIAKKQGVKTGMALWQAKQVCPEIIFVPPRMDLYLRFSQMAREIYSEYTDKIEPYGIDEAWVRP